MNTDQFPCLKKKIITGKVRKVFLLLNECGDLPFLFQNLSSLSSRQRLIENLCSVLFRGNDIKFQILPNNSAFPFVFSIIRPGARRKKP